MARLKIGEITTSIELPEISVNTEEPVVQEEKVAPTEVETAILCQNELHQDVEGLNVRLSELEAKVSKEQGKLSAHRDAFNSKAAELSAYLDGIHNKLNKKEVIKPVVETRTITVDNSKEMLQQIEESEDSVRLTVNSMFMKLENRIDNEFKKTKEKQLKKDLVLGFTVLALCVLAILK